MTEIEQMSALYAGAERRSPGSDEISRRIARHAVLVPGTKVLDLGCGAGPTARILAREYGCHVTAVDVDDSALDILVENVRRDGVSERIRPVCEDMKILSLDERSFHAVVAEDSVQHMGGPFGETLSRLRSLLVRHGKLILTMRARVARRVPSDVVRFFSERGEVFLYPREILLALERAGLEPMAAEALSEGLVDDHFAFLEGRLSRLPEHDGAAAKIGAEIALFRSPAGRMSVNYVLAVGRRREPGEKPPPARGGE
jgi:SAM-dependent methyltransferase